MPRYAAHNYTQALAPPRSGWETFWNRLVREGLLTLPDSSILKKDDRFFLHGLSYIVEINQNKTYRNYMYSNPEYRKWPEAKRVLAVFEICYKTFGGEKANDQSVKANNE